MISQGLFNQAGRANSYNILMLFSLDCFCLTFSRIQLDVLGVTLNYAYPVYVKALILPYLSSFKTMIVFSQSCSLILVCLCLTCLVIKPMCLMSRFCFHLFLQVHNVLKLKTSLNINLLQTLDLRPASAPYCQDNGFPAQKIELFIGFLLLCFFASPRHLKATTAFHCIQSE